MAYTSRLARTLQARLLVVHVVSEADVEFLKTTSRHLQSYITAETLREVLYADADKCLAAIIEQEQVAERL